MAQPGQPISRARFDKLLYGRVMIEDVIGRNLGFIPADFAPDVFKPGGQIVFVDRTSGRIAEPIGGVVVGPTR